MATHRLVKVEIGCLCLCVCGIGACVLVNGRGKGVETRETPNQVATTCLWLEAREVLSWLGLAFASICPHD